MILHSKIGNTGLNLVALIPIANFTSKATEIKNITNIFTLIAAAFALVTGYFISKGMNNVFNNFINVTRKAAEGDFTVNIHTKRKDQFGMLAETFNSMMSNMRELVMGAKTTAETVIESANIVAVTSEEVAVVSREVTKSVEEISQGATVQSSDLEQSSIKMNDLAEKINAVSDSVTTIESYSRHTIHRTKEGFDSIVDLENKATETTEIIRKIISDIELLDNNSKNISNIVEVIDGIADQTNLLALNAAIEAARAGESGMGFAVVAEEIKKLAEQSALATKEISQIIADNQKQVQLTTERALSSENILRSQNTAMSNTMEIFKEITESMEALVDKLEDITSGIKDIDSFKNETVTSIQNISSVSEEIASSTEEVTASTEEQLSSIEELSNLTHQLNDAAIKLKEAIKRFIID
jgi:methyl-accepting chemotaxis protein